MYKNLILIVAVAILATAGFKFANSRGYFLSLNKDQALSAEIGKTLDVVHAYCNNGQHGSGEVCYSERFETVAEQNGPQFAFAVLHALQQIEPGTRGCHLIAHGIGHGTFKRDPKNWQKDIRDINPTCNYGAIHGILEGFLDTQPDHTLTKKFLPEICGPTPRADCNHIIGHLTLVETRGDVTRALALCEAFTDPQQLDFCDTGVFMEEETAINLVEHGFADQSWLNWPARLATLEKMCRTYSGEKGAACWQELAHVSLVKFGNDPKKEFDFCGTSQVKDGAMRCKRHSIGIIAAGKNFDLSSLKYMCDLPQSGDPNFKSDCYVQLAASTMSTIPDQFERVKEFCQSLDAKYQEACNAQVSGYINYQKTNVD